MVTMEREEIQKGIENKSMSPFPFPVEPPEKLMNFIINNIPQLMDYLQGPILKILSIIKPIGRLMGFGTPKHKVIRLKEHLMSLKDGAKLATDIYLPEHIFKKKGKGPTFLVRLPYGKDLMSIVGYLFASLGFVVVLQDIRGCMHSRDYGTNSFMLSEGTDGLETLHWISKRFWYNGRIGMWGGSYFGLTQLAVSEKTDGLLTCINPFESCTANFLAHRGGLHLHGFKIAFYPICNLVTNSTLSFNFDKAGDEKVLKKLMNPKFNLYNEPLQTTKYLISWSEVATLKTFEEQVNLLNERLGLKWNPKKKDVGEFEKLLNELFYYGRVKNDSEFFAHALDYQYRPLTPILAIAGLFDPFCDGTIQDLKKFQEVSPDYCKKHFKLIIGPWTHGGMEDPSPKALKTLISFGQTLLSTWWFDYWLKGEEKETLDIPMVRIYILNKGIWRHFNAWPPKSEELKLYIHSKGNANTRFGDGILSITPPEKEPPDEYVFDPLDPCPTRGGRNLLIDNGTKDQSDIEERSDVLVYTSEKLEKGIEIIGEVKLVFFAASSARDTDFMAKLLDVLPNGKKAFNILDDGIRARFREGDLENPSLLEPSKIYRYEINLGTAAIYFPKGHRIRLEISSSNFPRFDINSNLAGEEHKDGCITANQKIFHDSQHQSHVILPVYKKRLNLKIQTN
ncbi:MAG: CocE/NonD family hydrolase [Candidatus Helarchaeota archaeon]|nr:CocE/NonD family hydrolase [Candidatus Helarchaeota archaeon]